METKCLEIRDSMTFLPVICIRPVADNSSQGYLLRRDGYNATEGETCIIMIDAQCRGVAYDPYKWSSRARTLPVAHQYIQDHWTALIDGDVVDVEFILGEKDAPKRSERFS